MSGKLEQHEYDALWDYVQGRCEPALAGRIEQLVRSDPRWSRRYARIKALDEALDAYEAPPAPGDLLARIIRAAHGERRKMRSGARWRTFARVAASVATAAAIILAVMVVEINPPSTTKPTARTDQSNIAPTPGSERVDRLLSGVPSQDRFLVENLDFFRNYDVLVNFETIREIERLEKNQPADI